MTCISSTSSEIPKDQTFPVASQTQARMSPSKPARGSQIILKAGTEAEPFRSRWLSNLTQFRELFNDWRNAEEAERQDWWVASTAIPLVAATTAPLANLMSVVALVTPWRNELHPGQLDSQGLVLQTGFHDPHWCLGLNASSVAVGVLGNLFLLFNFTQKMPYIVALPASICLWFLATGILVGALISEHVYIPPIPPNQVYSSGFWSAVIAAVLYFILAIILLVNMLGYVLGHYPHRFALTDDQRTLILQTTSLMIWLAVGAAIFQQLIGITFSDALYFSDVTILTLGFGDIVAQTSVARGLILPYAVIGIVILALIIASISRFARELTNANVVKSHLHHRRAQVLKHSFSVNDETELATLPRGEPGQEENNEQRNPIQAIMSKLTSSKRSRMLIMREEKDRFDAMRAIQDETLRFRRWLSLMMSLLAFVVVWCGGAGVFSSLESLTYFEALYFGFCCLLTIGYGDITPTTNPGRPFFVIWSLIAIPTMTILISKMSDTIMSAVDAATNFVAKYTVLPEEGRYTDFVSKFPKLRAFLELRGERQRIKRGFVVGDEDLEAGDNAARNKKAIGDYDAARPPPRTLTELEKHRESPPRLARDLIFAIRRVAQDVVADEIKRYSYEEWVEFTQLIRFTNPNASNAPDIELDENEWGLIEWDWMGENSPMMAEQTEPEWVLNRLTESLLRFMAGVESRFNENGRDGSHTFLFQKEERSDADEAETDHRAELASESESRLPTSESSTR